MIRERVRKAIMILLMNAGFVLHGCGAGELKVEILTVEQAAWLISQQQGQVVMLEFFQSTCVHCQTQMSVIKALHQQNKDKPVVFIGLSIDSSEEELRSYLRIYSLPFKPRLLRDATRDATMEELRSAMSPFGIVFGENFYIPFMAVLGKDGQKIAQWDGVTEQSVIQEAIDQGLQ